MEKKQTKKKNKQKNKKKKKQKKQQKKKSKHGGSELTSLFILESRSLSSLVNTLEQWAILRSLGEAGRKGGRSSTSALTGVNELLFIIPDYCVVLEVQQRRHS